MANRWDGVIGPDLVGDPPKLPEISSIVSALTGEIRAPMGRWTVTNDVTSFLKPYWVPLTAPSGEAKSTNAHIRHTYNINH